MPGRTVAGFYKFFSWPEYRTARRRLQAVCDAGAVKGTILLAEEGINGTIAGSRAALDKVLQQLRSDPRMGDLTFKYSQASDAPFYRMKVRLKREIVTIGVAGLDPTQSVGEYVEPQHWNALVQDPDVLVLDTRNDYEVAIGTFRGAVDPAIRRFRDFPRYVQTHLDAATHKRVAMFCTGGIRCEKATALLLHEGFERVYHLQGGILNYLETIPTEQSLWQGECFVFDNRVALGHALHEGDAKLCFGCRRPLAPDATASPHYEEGICCPQCYTKLTPAQRARRAERHRQVELAASRRQLHLGGSIGHGAADS